MGCLYLVSTPIGNLDDISARALRILKDVDLIAAEDTRRTKKLLSHFGIHTPITSYFEHNQARKTSFLISKLEQGNVALVSDAGTPGLNDPGYLVINAAIQGGFTIIPIPGPSAPITALVASGLPTDHFIYMGYLPRKSGDRKRVIAEIKNFPYTIIFLESPHRLLPSLIDLYANLGDREIVVARELTKKYEEIYRSSLAEAITHYSDLNPKGEITLILQGNPKPRLNWTDEVIDQYIQKYFEEGYSLSDVVNLINTESGRSHREIYKRAVLLEQKMKKE